VTVTWLPAEAPGPPRVAYAIGRQVGGAVERNRLRRRLRAIVAAGAPNLAPGSYLVGATAEATSLGAEELQTILRQAMQAAANR
jgi:ribonuclease P protein component